MDLNKLDLAAGRRAFLAGLGLSAAGALVLGGGPAAAQAAPSAADVFNFALNFEYLGFRFYNFAVNDAPRNPPAGVSESSFIRGPLGQAGEANGGHAVPFSDPIVAGLAREFLEDERAHYLLLQRILGPQGYIAQPAINFGIGFNAFARFSGLTSPTGTFDAFANDDNFLIGAMILEDVCVTALKGATPLLRGNEFLEAAAGLLGAEAYQAGAIRANMARRGLFTQAQQVSDLRDYFDGPSDIDQGIGTATIPNIVPADANALAFSRTPQQVINIAYGTTNGRPGEFTSGFFPNGLNGTIR